MNIFISFASEQKILAEEISLRLKERGHTVFFSAGVLPHGVSYDYRIQDAVNIAHLFIFLVSPQSVEQGRYTLTELGLARMKWSHPGDNILPVMVSLTPYQDIPPYLRAVTILEPAGNVAAEVSATVDKLTLHARTHRSRRRVALGSLSVFLLLILGYSGYFFYPWLGYYVYTPDLCAAGTRRADRSIVDTKPTKELETYLQGLRSGTHSFNWSFDGSEAARQLGFSRRFATTYGEAIQYVKAQRSVHINQIIGFLDDVLEKERSIDALVIRPDRRLAAIIYLRSYQALECSFPSDVVNNAPPAFRIFSQLKAAYPGFMLASPDSAAFAEAYDQLVMRLREEIDKKGSVSAWELPALFREVILKAPGKAA